MSEYSVNSLLKDPWWSLFSLETDHSPTSEQEKVTWQSVASKQPQQEGTQLVPVADSHMPSNGAFVGEWVRELAWFKACATQGPTPVGRGTADESVSQAQGANPPEGGDEKSGNLQGMAMEDGALEGEINEEMGKRKQGMFMEETGSKQRRVRSGRLLGA
eukprot:GHVS01054591.1.p1 GENE.GHVS01054591.1~~GHVS01054591.1.p1  ORF type:complete len:160 (+),score=22.97 GHVS01054591.1:77-556(+)